MSSAYVRTQIKDFLAANAPGEKIVDLTGRFEEIGELLENEGILDDADWLGLDFIGNDEVPITVPATNLSGKYRETGVIYFHLVTRAALGQSASVLSRGEALRDLLRGQRIGNMIVESTTPVNFGAGAALRFEGGYISGSFLLSYERDLDL